MPSVLEEIAEVLDRDAALRIGLRYGGQKPYFSMELTERHPLVIAAGGQDQARRIAHLFMGEVCIPLTPFLSSAKNLYRFARMRRDGMKIAPASHALAISERTARRWERLLEGAISNNDLIAYGKAIGDEW